MATGHHVRNPLEWGVDLVKAAGRTAEGVGRAAQGADATRYAAPPAARRITPRDLWIALARGLDDFGASRSDVVLLCVVYPLAGLVLARLAHGYDMLPLIFPLASGFALIGPVAAVGFYEMSRQRERGGAVDWSGAFALVRSPRFGAVVLLGMLLLGIFMAWLAAAQAVYALTLGPEPPASIGAFLGDVFTTPGGWAMIVAGMAVGFLFAVAVLMISVVSFPLLLDRDVGIATAMATSIRAVLANPIPMAAWGLIVAGGLALGTIPLFLGLLVVVPVLGHATWHLYRAVVAPGAGIDERRFR